MPPSPSRSTATSCERHATARGAICCAPICATRIQPSCGSSTSSSSRSRPRSRTSRTDLQLRPIHHQLEHRIEAHIFVAFLAYCLHVTLRARLKPLAPGLTPRAVLDKLAPHPDARRSLPHHRWPHADPEPLHRTQHRPEASREATQARPAVPAATANHRASGEANARRDPPGVVETFEEATLILFTFSLQSAK